MFYDKYIMLCKEKNVKPSVVAREIGVSAAAVTKWKNGSIPSRDKLEAIGKILGVDADYLMNEDEVYVDISSKVSILKKAAALPQRVFSINNCTTLDPEQMFRIATFVRADTFFLQNRNNLDYSAAPISEGQKFDFNTLHMIMGFLDGCAVNDDYQTLQIQLSRIVLYNMSKFTDKGGRKCDVQYLKNISELSSAKLEYLSSGKANADLTLNFGLNFSDLVTINRYTGASYLYMFTGINGDFEVAIV